MGLFNKNKKKVDKENKVKNKYDFKIIIWEDVGYSVREVKTFFASRFVDEDKVPFIHNEELNFLELYPQDIKDINSINEKEIDRKISDFEKQLKTIRNKKLEEYEENEPNTLDLEFNLRVLKAKKRGLKFSKSASYVNFDKEGNVCFNFLRKGNSFFPFKWDTDTNYIHTAPEPVVKKAGILLRNKESKYLSKKIIEGTTLILLIVAILGVIANIFLGGYLWTKYDQSNVGKLARDNLELSKICSNIVIDNAKVIQKAQSDILGKAEQIKNLTTKTPSNLPLVGGLIPN